nr:MAG TPA: hypothetical protein [Caudoviricetes sp.]
MNLLFHTLLFCAQKSGNSIKLPLYGEIRT